MIAVEEYSRIPITTTRMIAWDSPSTWTDSPSTSPTAIPTFQPLTKDNLTLHTHSINDSNNYMMDWYHNSMKNGLPSPPPSPNSVNTDFKHRGRKISTTTQNVAIDAYPLPFPYHNDSTFLPTVETGRTRFDSESTQSLYDSQPSSPTLCKRYQYTATRGNRRRGSSTTSYYSSNTLTTTTTTMTETDLATGVIPKHSPSAKRQLKTLVSRSSPRLSTLLEKNQVPVDSSKVTLGHNLPSSQQYHQHRQSSVAHKSKSTTALSASNNIITMETEPWVYHPSPYVTYQQQNQSDPPPSPSPSPRRQESLLLKFAKRIWPFKQY